jgi:hypothetical protein
LGSLVNAYARLAQSRGGAAASVGATTSGLHFAKKALESGEVVEGSSPGSERLDALFEIYASLVPILQEARRPDEQRQVIDRLLRLAPKLQPLRQAQAWKEMARHNETKNSVSEAADAFARALPILRELSKSPNPPAGTEANLISTLVGYGRCLGLAGDFVGAAAILKEAAERSAASTARDPSSAKSARQLYWSHITLGDVFAGPARFHLGKPAAAAEQYRNARAVAERMVRADPANDVVKLDLARALTREAYALSALQPAEAVALFDRAHQLLLQTSPGNHSALRARLDCLTGAVEPLLHLGEFSKARLQVNESRRLFHQMTTAGVTADDASVRRARAMRLYAARRTRDALTEAQTHLALLPSNTRPFLGDNFVAVELLERIRMYAETLDHPACLTATERLVRIWEDLRAANPGSAFIRGQSERARALKQKGCAAGVYATAGLR